MQEYSKYSYREDFNIRSLQFSTGAGEFISKQNGSGLGLNHAEYLLRKMESNYPPEGIISNRDVVEEILANQRKMHELEPSWMPKSAYTHDESFKQHIPEKNVTFGKDHHTFPRQDFQMRDSQQSISVREFDSQSGLAAQFNPPSRDSLPDTQVRIRSTQIQNPSWTEEADFTNIKSPEQERRSAGLLPNHEVERLTSGAAKQPEHPEQEQAEEQEQHQATDSRNEPHAIIEAAAPLGRPLVQSVPLLSEGCVESRLLSRSEAGREGLGVGRAVCCAGCGACEGCVCAAEDPMLFGSMRPQSCAGAEGISGFESQEAAGGDETGRREVEAESCAKSEGWPLGPEDASEELQLERAVEEDQVMRASGTSAGTFRRLFEDF